MVTAVECVSGDGRYLTPMIIWPATKVILLFVILLRTCDQGSHKRAQYLNGMATMPVIIFLVKYD
jgi:hypothetical protein